MCVYCLLYEPRIRAVGLSAVKQRAALRAVQQSCLPLGRRQDGDGAETDSVKVRLRRKSFFGGGGVLGMREGVSIWSVLIIPFKV